MSTRGSAEVRDMVAEVEQPFGTLRKKMREDEAQLYKHEDYLNELTKSLAPELDTKIALPSARPQTVARDSIGILRQSLQFHVEPAGPRPTDDKRADKRELMYAHLWATNLNKGDRVLGPTYRLQTVSRGAVWWLDWDPFALPKEESERDAYRRSYSPFKLNVYDFSTVAFLPSEDGMSTSLAVRRFKLPYYDLAKRYGQGKDRTPLEILHTEFPWLRGGKGQSVEASDLYSKSAEVCVIDDGTTICHYLDLNGQDEGYKQIGADYANPWGSVGVVIVPGEFNVDAELLEDRYRPLIGALLTEQKNVDKLASHMASLALTPKKLAQHPSDEVIQSALISDKTIPGAKVEKDGTVTIYGEPFLWGTDLNPAVPELLQRRMEDRDAALPSPFLTNPDPVLLKGTTAAGQLNAHETSNRSYDQARTYVIAAVVETCKKIDHFICDGHMNRKGQPAEANEKLYIRATGNEPTRKYMGDQKGKEFEIGPEDYEEGDVLEVTPVAMTESQKYRDFELKLEQYKAHIVTFDELIATVTEDVSGQKEKLEVERRYQQLGPMLDQADLLAMVEAIKLDSNGAMDLSLLLNPNMAPPVANEGQIDADTGGGMTATAPPPTSMPAVGAMG